MILITGASGTVGRALLTEVARSGEKHRAMYRSKEDAAKAPAGTEAVIADFKDRTSLAPALRGVESVYLVCSPIPDLVQLEENVIAAAEAAGVRRIVLNSTLGAGDYGKSFPSWHRKVEDKLKTTKMARCVLQPNSFMGECAHLLYAKHSRAGRIFRRDGRRANELLGCAGHCRGGSESSSRRRP